MTALISETLRIPVADTEPSITLEARYSQGAGAGGAVVAPPHPLYGGSMDNPVVVATLAGLSQASLATLSFNFRGTEGSEGERSDDLVAAVSDYGAAIAALAERSQGPYFAAGYSFGAGTALLAAREQHVNIAGVVLLAPPLGMLLSADLQAFAGKILIVVGDDDEYAPLPELRARVSVRSDATLEVITGADHFFHFGGLPEISELVRNWIATL
jgi:alpha/beta superfamily hydrolase